MSTNLTPYIALLCQLREDLAGNLARMGVSASIDEPLQTLIPKVLRIAQGDTSQQVFLASLKAEFDVSYGFFGPGEVAEFAGMCAISALCRIKALRVEITGTDASTLTVEASGWTVQKGSGVTAVYQPAGGLSRFEAQDALDGVSIHGDGETSVSATIRVYAVGEAGLTIAASGSTSLEYKYGATWDVLEALGYTWGELNGKTWDEIEHIGKPG